MQKLLFPVQNGGFCAPKKGLGNKKEAPAGGRELTFLYQIHKFLARLGLLEEAGEVGGRGEGVLLFDPSHLHTHVLRLDDDHDSEGVERPLDAIFYLHREPFLYLQAAGKDVHDARNLAQAGDILFGDVRDMSLAEERQHVVLAEGKEVDILDNDHLLIIFLLEHGGAEDGLGVFAVAFCQKLHRFSYSQRGFQQSLALGVFSQEGKDVSIMAGEGFLVF